MPLNATRGRGSTLRAYEPRGQHGFSPVEVLLAATIFGFLVTALIGAIIYGRSSTADAGDHARATALAEEGAEAVRNIRDAAYSNVAAGTFGLAKAGGVWTFSGSSDTTGIYTRQIIVATVDGTRKTVTSRVTWPQNVGTGQVEVTVRLTNWKASITSWTNAILSGSVNATGTNDALKVATVGNYAYVVRGTAVPNFLIYNVSTPATPGLVGSLTLTGSALNVTVSGNFAYVASDDDNGELKVINVTTPATPTLAGTYNATGTANGTGVFINGTTVYLTRIGSATVNSFELTLINVTVPGTPVLIGGYNNNINMNEVYVTGNNAYVATADNATEVLSINITVPAAPTLAGSLNLASNNDALTITGFGTRLLVGQGTSFHSISISTPATPTLQGSVTSTGPGTIQDVVTDGATYAFIGTNAGAAEFQVVNVTVPATPSVVRTVDLTGATTLNGVGYNASSDIVVGTASSDTQEVVTFVKN